MNMSRSTTAEHRPMPTHDCPKNIRHKDKYKLNQSLLQNSRHGGSRELTIGDNQNLKIDSEITQV